MLNYQIMVFCVWILARSAQFYRWVLFWFVYGRLKRPEISDCGTRWNENDNKAAHNTAVTSIELNDYKIFRNKPTYD